MTAMPDPARLVKRSADVAVRAGMTEDEARAGVFAVARALVLATKPLYDDPRTRNGDLLEWVRQVYQAAAARAGRVSAG